MTGRPCEACRHPDRGQLDAALLAGGSSRVLGERYGVGANSLLRHKNNHLTIQLEAARQARRRVVEEPSPEATPPGSGPPDRLTRHRVALGATLEVLRDARTAGNGDLVLRAVDRLLALDAREDRVTGIRDAAVAVEQATSREAATVVTAALAALEGHPEARVALASILERESA